MPIERVSKPRSSPCRWLPFLGAIAVIGFGIAAGPVRAETTGNSSGLELGQQSELCRELDRGIREWKMQRRDCGIPFPSGNADFSLLRWEPIDPAKNEALVSDIFYWANGLKSALWNYHTFYRSQLERRHREIDQAMKEAVWGPARDFVRGLIAEGRLELQRSRVRMIPNGPELWIYRMTPVSLNRNMYGKDLDPPIVVDDHPCARTDLPGSDKEYVYYAPPTENIYANFYLRQRGHDTQLRFFVWRGGLFRFRFGQVSYLKPFADQTRYGDFHPVSICTFKQPTETGQ